MTAAKLTWSEATMTARTEAATAIEKYLRARRKDIQAVNPEQLTDDEMEEMNLDGKILSSWIVSAEFVDMADMEESAIVYGDSGCTPATQQGLARYAAEDL
ncbi:hypothetical protein SEA_WOLLYPOG_85 [Arthrobacter phage Wollypog]|uniref:Uncharacterized protein n=1 Tax=Arthrobacter phage Wollypog TaxID=2790985 RepID=A0A7T3KCG8_9CAUD|nr:hypothetical protein PP291_gp85 [Arthrobacter phage Wollypog]QPX62634.1 hypothetical protein SEA_WOLLYPOG_85 [Arthrobacter phage Wollypog]